MSKRYAREKFPLKGKLFIIGLLVIFFLGFTTDFIFRTEFTVQSNNNFPSSKVNILVTGHDEDHYGISRADTIIIASIDIEEKEAGLLFVPRDTRVQIPDRGINRINASYAFGGPRLVSRTLEDFLDIEIDYHVDLDFDAFIKIIDALGGVELEVEEHLDYQDEAGDLTIDIPPGKQTLDGEEALKYVRYRDQTQGDIGRVARQQKFIESLVDQVLSPQIITRIPAVTQEVIRAVNTDIPIQDITAFLNVARDLDLARLETAMLPGSPEYINNASYWIADEREKELLVDQLIRSKEYFTNTEVEMTIYNGNGVPGQAGKMAERLERYGFQVERLANADHYNYQTTKIHYFHEETEEVAKNIQQYIGGQIVASSSSEEEYNNRLEIIVGQDMLNNETGEVGEVD